MELAGGCAVYQIKNQIKIDIKLFNEYSFKLISSIINYPSYQ